MRAVEDGQAQGLLFVIRAIVEGNVAELRMGILNVSQGLRFRSESVPL